MSLYASNGTKSVIGLDEYESDADLASVELFKGFSHSLLIFGSVSCLIFMLIGIPGNFITIIALARYKKIRNATALFIIHLHITDFLFCLTILPIVGVTFFERHWTLGKTLCRLYPMTKYMLTASSLLTISGIAINRYVMCCHPLLYPRLFRGRYICLMFIVMWMFNFGLIAPSYFEIYGRFSLVPNGFCTMVRDKHNRSPKLALLIIAFVIPCTILCICYIRLMWVVKKTSRKSQQIQTIPSSSEITTEKNSNRETDDGPNEAAAFHTRFKAAFRKTTREHRLPNKKDKRLRTMIVIIMVTFFVCRLPYLLVNIVNEKSAQNPEACVIGYTLIHSMNCINPIIYVVTSCEYRKAYKNLFRTHKF